MMNTPDTSYKNEFRADGKTIKLSPIDEYLGEFIASLSEGKNPHVRLAVSLISRNLRDGHVCLNLRDYVGKSLEAKEGSENSKVGPDLSTLLAELKKDENVGLPGEFKPLILDVHDRLYFHRYWQYEQDIVRFIRKRWSISSENEPPKKTVQEKLQFYFPEICGEKISWPAVAAVAACLKNFLVITGSPGTGKTTTVTKILALLVDAVSGNQRIALCAPTGKAAQRLEESVRKTKAATDWPENVKHAIPNEAKTIHRLLGSIRFSPYFKYHESNPLPYDIVVVDESSMVDLPLMAKLMTALSENARLILLGDKDQLASVEAGAVLGGICFPASLNIFSHSFGRRVAEIYGTEVKSDNDPPGLKDCIIELKQNYRFHEESGVNVVSQAIRNGDAGRMGYFMETRKYSDIQFCDLGRTKKEISDMIDRFTDAYREYIDEVISMRFHMEDIFSLFERFRVLCALRMGPWGVEQINRLIEKSLSDKGLIRSVSGYYEGKPVIVTKNDYQMNLFNGDIGIVLRDTHDDNRFKVFFRHGKDNMRKVALDRLPPHETVWAMTVHKSQGSEFDRVALILSDEENPILTRELVYTGVTRARYSAQIWSDPNIFMKSIKNQIVRYSGLTDALK